MYMYIYSLPGESNAFADHICIAQNSRRHHLTKLGQQRVQVVFLKVWRQIGYVQIGRVLFLLLLKQSTQYL